MDSIEEAIEEFKRTRHNVYMADPMQITRDAVGAERVSRDHIGRWLFELLQNSDDAYATEVRILVKQDTIYVADNGEGIKPSAVSAICGTDLSDKPAGAIGRKGIGFKSVYEVSRNPQVLTINGQGIEFDPGKAEEWLTRNGFDGGHVPYQWIPFLLPWEEARQHDSNLNTFTEYKTVVALRNVQPEKRAKAKQLLKDWPPHALFAFRHVRRIIGPDLKIALTPGDGVWSLCGSRGNIPAEWQVRKHTLRPPQTLLENLGEDERRVISTDGVSFLIGTPLDNGCAVPTSEYLPIHVFYPTEQRGPVPLLLHAEFLVKSDRTALMPLDGSPFNAWVAEELAGHVCDFVNNSYCSDTPSRHVALLAPFPDRASHPVAREIWHRIADKAREDLRLADIEAKQRLTVTDARLISVSVEADLARTLLEAASLRAKLLHHTFDDDNEARKALKELSCEDVDDEDLMAAIAENAESLAGDTQWVWTCWEWLAAWVAEKTYGEENKERIERVKSLPIVSIGDNLIRPSDLAGRIMAWNPDAGMGNLPDWLPLTFVEDWFREKLRAVTEREHPIKKLIKDVGIEEPGADIILRAVGLAIDQFWKDKNGNPERFLQFILEQDWHETSNASQALQRCPVPLSRPLEGKTWVQAREAYFGREWGNDLLAELYAGIETVAWVAEENTGDDKDKRRQILDWLGVTHFPRIVEERFKSNVWDLPEGCGEWKKYLQTARDPEDRRVQQISVARLDHLSVPDVDRREATLLIRLIVKNWTYYCDHAKVKAQVSRGREQYYRSWPVKAKWWWEICEKISTTCRNGGREHVPLNAQWIPYKPTQKDIGDLLPVVDLDAFGDDKGIVREWLVKEVHLRTSIEQLTADEWKELLSTRIPAKVPRERLDSDEKLQDKVTGWYTACLQTVAYQETLTQGDFERCPLLCRKGDTWKYVDDGPRYLDDDSDLVKAFAQDIWLFHIGSSQRSVAMKYFGVLSISKSVETQVQPGEPKSPLAGELQSQLSASLRYLYAWRSAQSMQAAESLSTRLKELQVLIVPVLKVNLSLNGMQHKVERRWHVEEKSIFLHEDHQNVAEMGQALAEFVGMKSDADFYENLLRCKDDQQRKEKLVSKGMAAPEVERHLREYDGLSEDNAPNPWPPPPVEGEGTDNEQSSTPPAPPGDSTPKQQGQPLEGKEQGEKPGATPAPSQTSKQPLRLKDAHTIRYELGTPPTLHRDSGGASGGGGTPNQGSSLTEQEKTELENVGRHIATRELQKLGYQVEDMPQENPGFDLRATKAGQELRVEVKTHTGRAAIVEVTGRQYEEYLRQREYLWELWNVEHLAENDTEPVTITRYSVIPEDALDTRTFRVDLRKCESPVSPELHTT